MVRLKGRKDVEKMLHRMNGKVKGEGRKLLYNTALSIVKDAKKVAPVKDGVLRNSITILKAEKGGMSLTVGSNVDYAPYVEFGTHSMEAAHGSHGNWVGGQFIPTEPSITQWEAKSKRGAGRQEMPFLSPAFIKNSDVFVKKLRDMLKKLP